MNGWVPADQALAEIVQTLKAAQAPDNEIQKRSYQRIEQFSANLEFSKYLVHILAHLPSEQVGNDVRHIAGLLLKRNIHDAYLSFPPDLKQYVQSQVVSVLADPNPNIRNAVGSVVTTVVSQSESIESWPDLLSNLVALLDQTDPNAVAGGFNAFTKVCEDSADKLINSPSRPLNVLIPRFIRYFSHQNPTFRKDALSCINYLMFSLPEELVSHMDLFLQGLSHLTQDTSHGVKKLVCQSIIILLEVGTDYLLPHIKSIGQFILTTTQDSDESLALEACEFWSSFCDNPRFDDMRPVLEELLPQLIPILLERMVYSQGDIEIFEAEEKDQNESVPDRPEDIKPIFHKTKNPVADHSGAPADEEDDADYGNDGDDDVFVEWSLRKCAAMALDTLSNSFQNDILPILLPLLQERLASQGHWSVRESGILALGAIAEGCMAGITPHLPQLFPYLLHLMTDGAPLIRSISCWTVSRYARWAVDLQDHEGVLKPLMEVMLQCLLDPNKKVQEAACSAFCTLEEEAQQELIPYLGPILQNLMFAFSKYQAKNLLILFDAIGTLADSVGDALNNEDLIAILMPPLINKWNSLADDNRELFPLLECLTSVATALNVGFQSFAGPVFARCLRLIERGLLAHATGQVDAPDPEFIVCSVDLISGLVEGFKESAAGLVTSSNLMNLLFECMKHPVPDVRQSAFALLGDLSKNCIQVIQPGLPQIMPLLIKNLNPEHPSVCNNASWSIGEISIKLGKEVTPYVPEILKYLIPMINMQKLPRNLLENCSITIGRLGYVCPDSVAPHLPDFVQRWCLALRNIHDLTEREHSFYGLCYMVQANPNAVVPHFMYLCGAIASWDEKKFHLAPELKEMFRQILCTFKASLGENWTKYFQSFPAALRQFLISYYGM